MDSRTSHFLGTSTRNSFWNRVQGPRYSLQIHEQTPQQSAQERNGKSLLLKANPILVFQIGDVPPIGEPDL